MKARTIVALFATLLLFSCATTKQTPLQQRQQTMDNIVSYADAAELWYANTLTIRGKKVPIKSFFALIRSFEEEKREMGFLPESRVDHVYRPILSKDKQGIVVEYFSTPPLLQRDSTVEEELFEVTLEGFSFSPKQALRPQQENLLFLLIFLDEQDKPYQRILGYSILGMSNYSTVEMNNQIRAP